MIAVIASTAVVADRPLETSEVLLLFKQLCRQPANGWIPEGHIEAVHRSFNEISDEMIETYETVTTDGYRFAWQIRIRPDSDVAQSKEQDSKDFMEWNQDRTFTWDGMLYTLYFQPGNQAIVYEDPSIPVKVSGPLTAGHISWGRGIFTFESLSASLFSATTLQTKEGQQIKLSIQVDDRPQIEFVLDPARDNAVLSYTLQKADGSRVVQTYGNYVEHLGRWIPMNILIDRYDGKTLTDSDAWEIVSVQDFISEEESFSVAFRERALVEYNSPVLTKSAFYRYSKGFDIMPLLCKRFKADLRDDREKQNCGTVAVEQVLSKFEVPAADSDLESLVRADSGDTSLSQIQQLIQKKGLFCLPVKTDISGLKQFKDAQVLLHFPQKKHYVLLDRIDKDAVWLIDLDRQTFYYFMDIDRFEREWAGIALVISDKPLSLQDGDSPIPGPVLENITGSADYSCSELIQRYQVAYCPKMTLGTCGGRYIRWKELYGCQSDTSTSGGYCDGTGVIGSLYSSCIEDDTSSGECTTSGNYISRFMRACQR